ncbi:hypothetical protein GCM10009792_22900 [Microcella alkalica]|uniref:RNA-directed DNA polymerase n=1 Tax=Microcella alkalica TaxID=355930 RepID=A0A839E6C7_9MICO|nr:reverse transcriptase family protein [Microcella alkalica]MBA8846866.1 RNA-directed DNA polymerase [Microcella alkalica]
MVERLDPNLRSYFDLSSLVQVSGADSGFIEDVVDRRLSPYYVSAVPKRTGGKRHIEKPNAEILAIQQPILRDILMTRSPSEKVFSYVKGRSPVQCARQHLGARWLLRVDLKAFFYSISEVDIYYLFLKEFGFKQLTAFQLARLVTVVSDDSLEVSEVDLLKAHPHVSKYRSRYVAGYTPQVLGHLPHGAPTSGALSNLVSRQLDHAIAALAVQHELVFARYSDDIYLSARRPITRTQSTKVLSDLSGVIRGNGFVVNQTKTRMSFEDDKKLVLGIHVDGDRLRLRREYRDRIDYELHMIETHGAESHAQKRGDKGVAFLLGRVSGLIAHAQDVDPEWGRGRRARFRAILMDGKSTEALLHKHLTERRERLRST